MCRPHGTITFNGSNSAPIGYMCTAIIVSATIWFKIIELPVSKLPELDITMGTK
jgi:hypothetical protein